MKLGKSNMFGRVKFWTPEESAPMKKTRDRVFFGPPIKRVPMPEPDTITEVEVLTSVEEVLGFRLPMNTWGSSPQLRGRYKKLAVALFSLDSCSLILATLSPCICSACIRAVGREGQALCGVSLYKLPTTSIPSMMATLRGALTETGVAAVYHETVPFDTVSEGKEIEYWSTEKVTGDTTFVMNLWPSIRLEVGGTTYSFVVQSRDLLRSFPIQGQLLGCVETDDDEESEFTLQG